MRRDDLPNLDIRISPGGSGHYTVDLKIGEREFPTGTLGQEVLAVGEVGQADDGARLFRALVADVALRSAWDQAGALHPRRRIRLRIDDSAPELHTLAWEALRDPSPAAAVRSLAADLDTPFSRYVVSPWEPLGPAPAPLRVLTAVAAPAGLENYDLAPIDRAAEVTTVTDALERAPAGLVQHTVLSGPCTLPALVAELERGYHVLHLVAHGAVSADCTRSVVFLEKPDGGIELVDADRFARAIDCLHRSLRLVVLMSCNTATRSPTDPRFGFAPALLGAGVPAVLAMQDRMPMPTGAAFTRAFYEELWTSGEIDRAANRARRVVITERLPGTAVPALYATLMSLRLWNHESPTGQVQEARAEETSAPASAAPRAGVEPPAEAAAAPLATAETVAAPQGTWEDFGGIFEDLQVVVGPGGCLHAFAVDDAHVLRHRRERAPGGEWGEWEEFAVGTCELSVTSDLHGRITVFMTDVEDRIRYRAADPSGVWEEWEEEFGHGVAMAATSRRDGRLVIVAEHEASVFASEEFDVGEEWTDWARIGGGTGGYGLVRNGADQVIFGGLVGDGALWTAIQRRPQGKWEQWIKHGTGYADAFLAKAPDGRVHLLAVDRDHALQWTVESKVGGPWQQFEQFAEGCRRAAIAWHGDGSGELFTIHAGTGAVWHADTRADADGSWQPLGGEGIAAMKAVMTPRGAVEVFALHERGQAFRLARSV